MLIYLKQSERLITVAEGTGDNLTDEDIKDGFVDYFMSTVYEQDGDELVEQDGGQILSSKMVADMDTEEIVDKILDYWEAKDEDYAILNS